MTAPSDADVAFVRGAPAALTYTDMSAAVRCPACASVVLLGSVAVVREQQEVSGFALPFRSEVAWLELTHLVGERRVHRWRDHDGFTVREIVALRIVDGACLVP